MLVIVNAGFLKEEVRAYLTKAATRSSTWAPSTCDPQDDYPDFAERVGEADQGRRWRRAAF